MRNEGERGTPKESEITVPEMHPTRDPSCRRFLTLWIRSRISRKFIPRSKTALAKVPRGGKYPRSESRYSAHKLTSAVTYMRCTVPLEELSADRAIILPCL